MKRVGEQGGRDGHTSLTHSSGHESRMRFATRGNVLLLLVLQFAVIISLPLFLPKKKNKSVVSPTPRFAGNFTRCVPALCRECTTFELRQDFPGCKPSGFRQQVSCTFQAKAHPFDTISTFPSNSNLPAKVHFRSCLPLFHGPEGGFLPFMMVMLFIGALSYYIVHLRLQRLQEAAERRIQSQLASAV